MSDPLSHRKALAVRPASYEVGYGKPPVSTRFRPGQSGNPDGRPKGSKNRSRAGGLEAERLKAIVLQEAYRTVTINDPKGELKVTLAQAVIRSLAVTAAKGNPRSQRLFTELLSSTERDNMRLHGEWLEAAITYKVEWERELESRAQLGVSAPDPVPHPDDIVIDLYTGTVAIRGPMTMEEKVFWDELPEVKSCCEEEIRRVDKMLMKDPSNLELQRELNELHRIKARIARALPD